MSIVPATAAPKAQNQWAMTHKIVYVALTPEDRPDFWTENQVDTMTATSDGEMLSFAKENSEKMPLPSGSKVLGAK